MVMMKKEEKKEVDNLFFLLSLSLHFNIDYKTWDGGDACFFRTSEIERKEKKLCYLNK